MTKKEQPENLTGYRKSEVAKQALVLATLDILQKKSIDATSTREIASKSKQNISAITYYFGGKEGLYLAAVQHIAALIQQRQYPILLEIERFLGAADSAAGEATALLKKLMRHTMAFHKEILGFTEIIAREQIHPTKAFTILYDGALRELQECGARLIAVAVGNQGTSEEFKLRFHALLGEVLIFRFARETILRGVGWKDIGERESDIVATLIEEHVELMLAALSEKKRVGARGKTLKARRGR
jgi:AcrR family transcriptional regulator